MVWWIKFEGATLKELAKPDKLLAWCILSSPRERVAGLEDPRSVREALKGSKQGGFWKYRVRDYRVIASIEDGALRVLVLQVGNRRDV